MAEVVIVSDAAEAGRLAAAAILRRLPALARPVLGVATGSAPLTTYAALADAGTDLADARAFALDEYVELPPRHPEGDRAVLEREFCVPLGFDPERLEVPDPDPERLVTAGERYENIIAAAGAWTCSSSESAAPGTSDSTSRARASPVARA